MRRFRASTAAAIFVGALAGSEPGARDARILPPGLDPGADTCDVATDVGTVPPDHVEPTIFLEPGDGEWRSFVLATSRLVAVSTVGDPLLADTNLVLYGGCSGGLPSLLILANEDRGPADFTSRVPTEGGRCLGPGRYFVAIGSYLRLGTEAPFEFRIEDLGPCALPPRDGYEPDDTLTTARSIAVTEPGIPPSRDPQRRGQARSIFPIDDIDYVRFQLPAPTFLRIRAAGGSDADPVLGLGLAADGTLLALNDNESLSSPASSIETCLPAGSYFVAVLARFLPDLFAYRLSIVPGGACAFEREPNGTIALAETLALRGGVGRVHGLQRSVAGVPDVDVYRFVVPRRRGVVIETTGYDRLDVDSWLELLDASGATVATNDDGGDGYLARIERVLPGGVYTVRVTASPFDFPPGDSWPYALTITLEDPPPLESEPNDACDEADPVSIGDRLLAALVPAGDRDRFDLALGPSAMGGFVVEVATRSNGDPILEIFDDPGTCSNRAACDDDGGEGLDARIECCLAGDGTYSVRVREFGDDTPIPDYQITFRVLGECLPGATCTIPSDQLGCHGSGVER